MFIIQDGGTSSGTHPTHPMALAAGFQMGSMHSMRSGVPSMEGSEAAMLSEAQMKKPPSGRHSARLVVSLKVQCSAVPLLHIVIINYHGFGYTIYDGHAVAPTFSEP